MSILISHQTGLQEMGLYSRRRAAFAGSEPHARSVILSQLRTDLVRFYETGGRSYEDS